MIFCGFNIEPLCSDVCRDPRRPQALAKICRNTGICCDFRAGAARKKYPGFILLRILRHWLYVRIITHYRLILYGELRITDSLCVGIRHHKLTLCVGNYALQTDYLCVVLRITDWLSRNSGPLWGDSDGQKRGRVPRMGVYTSLWSGFIDDAGRLFNEPDWCWFRVEFRISTHPPR